MTLLGALTSITLLITMISVFLGASFVLDYPSTPKKFLIFQTIYRVEELIACMLIVTLAGNWNPKSWKCFQTEPIPIRFGEEIDTESSFSSQQIGIRFSSATPHLPSPYSDVENHQSSGKYPILYVED